MCDSSSPTEDISEYHISHNEATVVEIEKGNTAIINLKNISREDIRNYRKEDCVRESDNTVVEVKKDNESDNRSNMGNKDNGVFNNKQNGPNQQTVYVQFQNARQIPQGGSEPLYYDPVSRNSFVMFVFMIVFVMLLLTAGFNVLVFLIHEMKQFYLRMGFIVAIPAMILVVGVSYAMSCSPCARQPPCNYICLVLAVIGMSNICAFITVRYNTSIILYAVIATTVVVFVCMLLACSRFDFTQWMIYVVVISVAFGALVLIVSLTMVFTGTYFKMLHLIILVIATLLNVIILTIELQTILGGKAIELSETDYALGAFLLYTSIVDVFLKMVQIFGLCGNLD